MAKVIQFGNHSIEITHPEKQFFPKNHITKGDVVDYYLKIAPRIFPYVKDRLISMQRFPEGIDHQGFFQKNAPDYFPEWIKTKNIATAEGKKVHYVVLSNIETLIYIVNQGCITPHIWLSRVEHLHTPDRIVFDLDPAPDTKFFRMRAVAIHLKKILEDHSLKPFLMTTGSRGLHIIVPICPEHTFDVVRQYALSLAELLVKEYPHEVTTQVHKQKREDNIFIDILRNGFGATAVMPFAIRPLPGAPIATPIFWHELMKVTPQKYTLKNIFRRLGRVNNPWEKMESSAELLKLKR